MNQMGDATVKIDVQEHELKALRTRVKELELLLVEQQVVQQAYLSGKVDLFEW